MDRYTIEEKIPISLDTAEKLNDYLETIASLLFQNKVKNVYEVVKIYEEQILLDLQQLGLSTKISLDDLDKVLAKYGTPRELVQEYLSLQKEGSNDNQKGSKKVIVSSASS
jgi:hypothetical protein